MTDGKQLKSGDNPTPPNYTVPAFFVRFLLETSQEHLTPRFYRKFLQETGLSRFEFDLPPLNGDLVATRDEASAFVAKIYSVTGEGVYPLFGHNLGLSIAKISFNTPLLQTLKAKAEPVSKDTNLALPAKLAVVAKLLNNAFQLNGQRAKGDGDSIIIESDDCMYCRSLKTDEMVCFIDKTFFSIMLKWLTGWTFMGEQFKSTARGDQACAFRLKPIDYDRTN